MDGGGGSGVESAGSVDSDAVTWVVVLVVRITLVAMVARIVDILPVVKRDEDISIAQ